MLAKVDERTNHCQLARLSLGERQEVWSLLLDVLEGWILVETGNVRWRGSGDAAGNNMANWCQQKSQEGQFPQRSPCGTAWVWGGWISSFCASSGPGLRRSHRAQGKQLEGWRGCATKMRPRCGAAKCAGTPVARARRTPRARLGMASECLPRD